MIEVVLSDGRCLYFSSPCRSQWPLFLYWFFLSCLSIGSSFLFDDWFLYRVSFCPVRWPVSRCQFTQLWLIVGVSNWITLSCPMSGITVPSYPIVVNGRCLYTGSFYPQNDRSLLVYLMRNHVCLNISPHPHPSSVFWLNDGMSYNQHKTFFQQ